jgi:hypothetical protein
VEGHLLVEGQAAAAVLDRPGRAGPAVCGEVAFPVEALLERLVLAAGAAEPLELGEARRATAGSRIWSPPWT